ncbi:hypothetical protein FHG87_016884 [Trinorchestia longiramus]|nr:hypothetical protein FHG87_016884 [Trinorchestia longiramus]
MKFYAKKRGGNSVADPCTGEDQAVDLQASSPSVLPAASPVSLPHFPLHSQLLASILAKTEGESNAAGKVDSSSEASNGGSLQTDNIADEVLPANTFDYSLNKEAADMPTNVATNQSETFEKTAPESIKLSSSDCSTTSTSPPVATPTTAAGSSPTYDLIRDLQQENESLRQKVFTQELLLLEQIRQNARQEHEFRLKRDREEHEARMTALRQDAALRKIMFRVQLCQWQGDA